MDFDSVCAQMSGISIHQKVNEKLVSDLNLIISEIINTGHYNIDIYELCVNCGHSLTWDQEYTVCNFDIQWLKTSGKVYFYETLNNYIKIETVENYNLVTRLYENILELFSLQVE
jgi:homoaconitase/3-isopropylmalate dehydratase large subunit